MLRNIKLHPLIRCQVAGQYRTDRTDSIMIVSQPQPRSAVVAGSQDIFAIWREYYITHLTCMARKAAHFLTCDHLPQAAVRLEIRLVSQSFRRLTAFPPELRQEIFQLK